MIMESTGVKFAIKEATLPRQQGAALPQSRAWWKISHGINAGDAGMIDAADAVDFGA
jgi:hypothetical protein